MSIYSRSYMRGSRAEDIRRPWALRSILIALIVLFLLQNIFRHWLGSAFFEATFALELTRFMDGWLFTIVSYGFLHSTEGALPWHLVFNALMLYWFGREIEMRIGSEHFLEAFLFCLIAGGGLWLLLQGMSGRNSLVIGASSAVFGVLYLYCRHLWHTPMSLFFLPLRFNGKQLFWVIGGFQLFFFLFAELPGNQTVDTAYSAHLGGIFGAFLYERHLLARRSLISLFRSASPIEIHPPDWQRKTAVKSARPTAYRVNVSPPASKTALKSEVDRILDKINDHGFGALTAEEKATLDRAKDLL